LFLAGISEILVISTPEDLSAFKRVLGDGSQYGVSFEYAIQPKPNGLAEAFIIGEKFIDQQNIALILGDNIFHGVGLGKQLETIQTSHGATIFAYQVSDPERYGVVEFTEDGAVLSIEEKPKFPKSNFAVPGLYFYDSQVVEIAKGIAPSDRGEIEITSVNEYDLKSGQLTTKILERGTTWLDTGTFDSLHAAASYVRIIEERQGTKICNLDEIAWNQGWISDAQLLQNAEQYSGNSIGRYLENLLK
jgi:glucose-1-phosphate thymidylyltransferase